MPKAKALMRRYRYSKWDGSQHSFDADAPGRRGRDRDFPTDDLFRELANNLIYGFDTEEALEWMMRNGFDLPSRQMRVMGLSELIQELRRRREQLFEKYNLDHALDEIKQALEDIRNFETQTVQSDSSLSDRERYQREAFLENLPPSPTEAIRTLDEYDFLDERAREIFEGLKSRFDDIRSVENFRDRHQPFFRGDEAVDFDQAKQILEEFNQLSDFERALDGGDFERIDPERLAEMLSEQGFESFLILQDMGAELRRAGLLSDGAGGPEITPRGMRRIGAQALRDIYDALDKDRPGAHETNERGAGRIVPESAHRYSYGDPFHVDLPRTFMNSLTRGGAGVPLELSPEDFEVHEVEHTSETATVMLVDMSWSMSWEGRFPAAKKVALALSHLIRTKYPRDAFYTVGFYTRARELSLKELPEIIWNSGDPFTNLQEGLRVADRLLARHKGSNKQIILVTDGQPTAYSYKGELLVEWPWDFGGVSPRASYETLKEVRRITQKNVRINTFMLDDSPALVSFINQLSRINKGRAFYTRPDMLGKYLLVDFIRGKKKKVG